MNNKGFATTNIIYGVVILLVMVMLLTLGILKDEYSNKKDFINDIKEDLNNCLENSKC